jgi:glyoxylase I family protein
MPQKPNLLGVHHVAIIASNYPASKHFYTQVLGCTLLEEVYREERQSFKADLAVNGVYQIELFSFPAWAPRPSRPEALGLRHLAFAVANVQEWYAYLTSLVTYIEPIRTDEHTGKQFFFIQDPDGLPIEFYER